MAVHPHGRGEHQQRLRKRHRVGGSSPRAWGTLPRNRRRPHGRRFIPTGVGNTADSQPSTDVRTVHPHGRGEHQSESGFSDADGGSSPRAWGTPDSPHVPGPEIRFIPTGVGNTLPPSP
ncbi:hypothetical protein C664_05166 [Thauera sp. 63]|nr:hypothetical protein C664_05166 [Thauera sp. 63]